MELVAEGFLSVKGFDATALGPVPATYGDGDLIDQGEIVRGRNIGLSAAVVDDAHPADVKAEGPSDNGVASFVEGGTAAGQGLKPRHGRKWRQCRRRLRSGGIPCLKKSAPDAPMYNSSRSRRGERWRQG